MLLLLNMDFGCQNKSLSSSVQQADNLDIKQEIKLAYLFHAKYWKNGNNFKTSREGYYENNKGSIIKQNKTFSTIKDIKELEEYLKIQLNEFYILLLFMYIKIFGMLYLKD